MRYYFADILTTFVPYPFISSPGLSKWSSKNEELLPPPSRIEGVFLEERLVTATSSYHTSGRLGQPGGETALRSHVRQVSRYWELQYALGKQSSIG